MSLLAVSPTILDLLIAKGGLIVSGLFVFSVLVFVHELGHFLLAKWHGVGVLEFAIGFGPTVWRKRVRETTYAIRAIPLGGFVRMVGDDPRAVLQGESAGSLPLEGEAAADPEIERLYADPRRWFLKKGYWAKCQIVLAGPFFNFIFAFFVSVFSLAMYGKASPVEESVIGDVVEGQVADKAGIRAKDRVISVDGAAVTRWEDLARRIRDSGGREVVLEIQRVGEGAASETLRIPVIPVAERNELDIVSGSSDAPAFRIGIRADAGRMAVGLGEATLLGALHVLGICEMTLRGTWAMIVGEISTKQIAGPVFIFKQAGESAGRGLEAMLGFMVFLSVSLGLLNLFPVPVLDGGHLVFFTIEAIIRRPLHIRVREFASQVGMVLLLALMFLALRNDLFVRG